MQVTSKYQNSLKDIKLKLVKIVKKTERSIVSSIVSFRIYEFYVLSS